MSGARALAAARARRAGGAKPISQQQQQQSISRSTSSPSLNNNSQNIELPQQNQKKINPALMLLSHNKIIENLQEVLTNLSEKVESQDNKITSSLDSLNVDDNNIVFFKNKLIKLEKDFNEIKKYILKVQTFSMESNLLTNDLKKRVETIENTFNINTSSNNELMTSMTNDSIEHEDLDNETLNNESLNNQELDNTLDILVDTKEE